MSNRRLKQLQKLLSDTSLIYRGIEGLVRTLIGAGTLIRNSQMLRPEQITKEFKLDGFVIDGPWSLGLAMSSEEVEHYSQSLVALANRELICDTLQITADVLARAARILLSGKDPYALDTYFSGNIAELWADKTGRAGSLLQPEERRFFKDCATPLRHCVRHNNAVIRPRMKISYSGNPSKWAINVWFQWHKGQPNRLRIPISESFKIFLTMKECGTEGIQQALRMLS